MEKILVTPSQAAELLGMSENTIRALCENGNIPSTKLGSHYKISVNLLKEWVDNKCRTGEVII